jgi:hypothetical protein
MLEMSILTRPRFLIVVLDEALGVTKSEEREILPKAR